MDNDLLPLRSAFACVESIIANPKFLDSLIFRLKSTVEIRLEILLRFLPDAANKVIFSLF